MYTQKRMEVNVGLPLRSFLWYLNNIEQGKTKRYSRWLRLLDTRYSAKGSVRGMEANLIFSITHLVYTLRKKSVHSVFDFSIFDLKSEPRSTYTKNPKIVIEVFSVCERAFEND